jgi:hypothetical protein
LIEFVSSSTAIAMEEKGIKWERKTFLDLGNADHLSILDESLSKMNEILEVLRFKILEQV